MLCESDIPPAAGRVVIEPLHIPDMTTTLPYFSIPRQDETMALAHDDDLDRPVAIKVHNPERITHQEDAEAFLIEAWK